MNSTALYEDIESASQQGIMNMSEQLMMNVSEETSTNQTSPLIPGPRPITDAILQIVQLIIVLTLMTLNGISFFCIFLVKKMKVATANLLGHLAMTNVIFGMTIATRSFMILSGNASDQVCLVIQTIVITTGGASLSGICFLCLDTYLCIKNMMIVKAKLSKSLINYIICLTWFVWFVLGQVALFVNNKGDGSYRGCHLACGLLSKTHLKVITALVSSHFIPITFFQVMTSHYLKAYDLKVSTGGHLGDSEPKPSDTSNSLHPERSTASTRQGVLVSAMQKKWLKMMTHTNRMVFFILALFTVSYGIYFIALGTWLACPSCLSAASLSQLATLIALYPLLSPVIYATNCKELRCIYRRMICPCTLNRVHSITVTHP